ncbi:MAG: M20/M25/M40 family metallo-hydrolase, partial [Verrucomicrobia bacterium]|nr:M20/M25/M40 family metallo-hydrolase [Verrucomicrobiota bacterium]
MKTAVHSTLDTRHAKTGPARPASSAVIRNVRTRARAAEVRNWIQRLLVELCRIDTTSGPDPARMRTAEDRCFRILERELGGLCFAGARLERRPVDPAIQFHPDFSQPHFTKTPARPRGLSPEKTCAGRSNLVYIAPGASGKSPGAAVALNAHIDVVAPYFPPRVRRGIVHGRGACDDKGPLVGMVAALKVLSETLAPAGLTLNRSVVAMFVVEEETGGNGSLSLAMDRGLKRL